MKNYKKDVEYSYEERGKFVLLGLTGRTGSGCTTVAEILHKDFNKLDLRDCLSHGYRNVDERKEYIIRQYFETDKNKWESFYVIEVSCIILEMIVRKPFSEFEHYLNKICSDKISNDVNIKKDFKKLFKEIKKERKDTKEYYCDKLRKFKKQFKEIADRVQAYSLLMQNFGNNIRSSGNPFKEKYISRKYLAIAQKVDEIINIITKSTKNDKSGRVCRICIDALRNPFEAMYFRNKYANFYLIAINADNDCRKRRLNYMPSQEIEKLDDVEFPEKLPIERTFIQQNIGACSEIADIHIFNENVSDAKYYKLTSQILKYVALILHPGLVTPTSVERCMQLAYNAKFNSGCLSRQVGAVVTRNDFSILSVGWNDVPHGQVPCNLRDVCGFCTNHDEEQYSMYELEDKKFNEQIKKIKNTVSNSRVLYQYCFKDVYNAIKKDKNQVYTRSLHAEENAFLQIAKYGGTAIKGGFLFTSASPCELCAKKAYQLGIEKIYYIVPYPGISQKHILSFGKNGNPMMILYYGAIGRAYVDLYTQRFPVKDELELVTGKNVKDIINPVEVEKWAKYIKYIADKDKSTERDVMEFLNTPKDYRDIILKKIQQIE